MKSPTFCVKVVNCSVAFGYSTEDFHIHEALLIESSPYFAALIGGGFAEGVSKTVTLSEPVDNVEAFQAIMENMYDGDYAVKYESEVAQAYSSSALVHTNVFLMASRLCMEDLEALAFSKLSKTVELSGTLITDGKWNTASVVAMVDRIYRFTPSAGDELKEGRAAGNLTDVSNKVATAPSTPAAKKHAHTRLKSAAKKTTQTNAAAEKTAETDSMTPPEPATAPKPKKPNLDQLMRSLIARTCAWKIEHLRDEVEFKKVLQKYPEFATDLISALVKGAPVEAIPVETLT